MSHIILMPEIKRLIVEGDNETLKEFFEDHHPRQSAEFLEELGSGDIWYILSLMEIEDASTVFSYFELEFQVELVKTASTDKVRPLLENLSSDDRADLFKVLDENSYKSLISVLPEDERADVEKLLSYEEGEAGSVMSTDYVTCRSDHRVSEVFKHVKEVAQGKETIYYIYVVNKDDVLTGVLSLKDLFLAEPYEIIKDIMQEDPVTCHISEDQEDIARKIEEYDLLAIPVVDSYGKLLGIVTHDDVIDILQEEQTEDVERLMAISGEVEERDYLDIPLLVHFKKRIPWLLSLFLVGNFSASIIDHFDSVLNKYVLLASFISLITATGGNTGSQAASVVLRALTLKEISFKDFFKVIFKEFRVALLMGSILASILFTRVFVVNLGADPESVKIAAAISIALVAQIVSATAVGSTLPLIAGKFKLDPSVVAMPAVTTIADLMGITVYFNVVKLILGI